MRVVAALGMMALLSGCAAAPLGREAVAATPAVAAQTAPRAPRASQQELLAVYWAERRKPAPTFTTFNAPASRAQRLQNFPKSTDSEDQQQLDIERATRESAATREAVRTAVRR